MSDASGPVNSPGAPDQVAAEARRGPSDPEARFLRFGLACGQWDGSKLAFILRHPRTSYQAGRAVLQLPELTASPSADLPGRAIRQALVPRTRVLRWWKPAFAVLPLPDCVSKVGTGARNQTLRRKVRNAEKQGVWCATVEDPAERHRLASLAAEFEQVHPDVRYRNARPDNSDLPDYPLWIAAYSADQRPLLLAVAAVDGQWAMLRYFRIIGSGQEQSDARYLAHLTLAQQLTAMEVRYLFDPGRASWIPQGIVHYQRMVGFRPYRIAVRKLSGAPG
jgi:hypothetical protein